MMKYRMRKIRSKSWEQHNALGDELKKLDRRLTAISLDLQTTYGAGSIAAKAARIAAKHFADLRFVLDVVVESDSRDVNVDLLNECYRG